MYVGTYAIFATHATYTNEVCLFLEHEFAPTYKGCLPRLTLQKEKRCFTFLTIFEAVSASGDELLPFEDGVGESVVEGPMRGALLGDGSLWTVLMNMSTYRGVKFGSQGRS
jgi:hypothetical protein